MSGDKGLLASITGDQDPKRLTLEEKALIDLYRSAGNNKKKAALTALKDKPKYGKLFSRFTGKKSSDEKSKREISTPLLGFTFFYSVSIYLLLLGFYYWEWHKDDK